MPDTDALIRDMLAIFERFGTSPDSTGRRHLDNRENLNHLGICCLRRTWRPSAEVVPDGTGFRPAYHTLTGECAPSCVKWNTTLEQARAHVAAQQPRQLGLSIGEGSAA